MYFLENAGFVVKCSHPENSFRWNLPNYFADQDRKPNMTLVLWENCPRNISSPCFSALNRNWRLALIVNLNPNGGSRYFGFFLWMMPPVYGRPNIRVKLGILDNDDEYLLCCAGDVDFNGCFGSWTFLSFQDFFSSMHQLSPNGVLRISCTMDYKEVPIISHIPESSISTTSADDDRYDSVGKDKENNEPEPKGVDRLVRNLKSLLLDKESSDVLLKVENRDFKAHKNILKARSPVFASMFQIHTKESTTGVVDIPDCSASAFDILLLYIYTGSADAISSDNVCDVYYAADKYQMDDLKSECVYFMEKNLSVGNFCEIMTLSLHHNEKGLQETSIEFFCANFKTIIKTVKWQKYLKDYPTQANELYIKAVNA